MSIQTEQLSNGDTKYIVRVKRGNGPRVVLGRYENPYAAIHVAVEEYREHLIRTVLDGNERSKALVRTRAAFERLYPADEQACQETTEAPRADGEAGSGRVPDAVSDGPTDYRSKAACWRV